MSDGTPNLWLESLRKYEESRASAKWRIETDYKKKKIESDTVKSFAFLNLTNDIGAPIYPAAHHSIWLDLMTDERIRKLLIIAPPEAAKTTWTILAYVGTYIGFYPERSVIIGSTSGGVAEQRSLSLRNAVESDTFRACFPHAKPVKKSGVLKWSPEKWSLATNGLIRPGRIHPTVAAYGTGGSVIGSRADLIVADDLLDFDSSRTAHQREFVETWFHNSLLSRRKSRTGRVIVIGTAWHHGDLYAKARREGSWVVCHTPLLSESKEVYAYITYPDDWNGPTYGDPIGQASL